MRTILRKHLTCEWGWRQVHNFMKKNNGCFTKRWWPLWNHFSEWGRHSLQYPCHEPSPKSLYEFCYQNCPMFSVCFPHSKNYCLRSNSSPNQMFHSTRCRPATTSALEASTWPQHHGLTEIPKPTWTVEVDLDVFILLSFFIFSAKMPKHRFPYYLGWYLTWSQMIPLELESAWPRVRVKVGAKLKAERQKIWVMLTRVNSPNQILAVQFWEAFLVLLPKRLWGISCPLKFCGIPLTIIYTKTKTQTTHKQESLGNSHGHVTHS